MRSSKSTLAHLYPSQTYTFEASFSEDDSLWEANIRESSGHVVERALTIIEEAFQDSDTCEHIE